MRRIFFWSFVISGGVAAALMFKRGEKLGTIAKDATTHPVKSLVRELRAV
ncbi:hypothetical protein ACFQBQ_11250 [Granulicella cerasi]|uniref:YtxH-like protein n=1 Tax=Granulicella cerasi TaxID=741063 RepID=A0ABW1ZBZ6_9BACT|nr:hypothetical protein [Granulicella cerasi]